MSPLETLYRLSGSVNYVGPALETKLIGGVRTRHRRNVVNYVRTTCVNCLVRASWRRFYLETWMNNPVLVSNEQLNNNLLMKYILGSSVTLLSVIAIRLPSFDEVNTERVRECLQNYVRESYKSFSSSNFVASLLSPSEPNENNFLSHER